MKKRQAIINDLVGYIKGISIAAGYLTTVGSSDVLKWRTNVTPKTNQLIISVDDTGLDWDDEARMQILNVSIKIGCIKADKNYEFISNLVHDIYRMLEDKEDAMNTKYGYIVITPVSDEINIEQWENEIAEAIMSIEIAMEASEKWAIDNGEYA